MDMLGYERGGGVGDDDGRVEEEDADERGDVGWHLRHAVKCTARHRARRDEPEAHRQIVRLTLIGERVREEGCPQGQSGVQAREREEHPYEESAARAVRVLSILGLVLCIWKGRARYRMEIAPGPGPAVAQAVEHRGLIFGVLLERGKLARAFLCARMPRSTRPHPIFGFLRHVGEAAARGSYERCFET